MPWIYLILGGCFEVGFTTCLGKVRATSGTEMWFWLFGFLVSCGLSMYLLYKASQSIPMGTAYAVWAGIGAVGTLLTGILIFRESLDFWRIFFVLTLIASIVGLKVVSH